MTHASGLWCRANKQPKRQVVYRDKIVEVPVDRVVTVERQVQSRTPLTRTHGHTRVSCACANLAGREEGGSDGGGSERQGERESARARERETLLSVLPEDARVKSASPLPCTLASIAHEHARTHAYGGCNVSTRALFHTHSLSLFRSLALTSKDRFSFSFSVSFSPLSVSLSCARGLACLQSRIEHLAG